VSVNSDNFEAAKNHSLLAQNFSDVSKFDTDKTVNLKTQNSKNMTSCSTAITQLHKDDAAR